MRYPGKTIAFLLPAIERLLKAPAQRGISILVLAPTRELALQVDSFRESRLVCEPQRIFT